VQNMLVKQVASAYDFQMCNKPQCTDCCVKIMNRSNRFEIIMDQQNKKNGPNAPVS